MAHHCDRSPRLYLPGLFRTNLDVEEMGFRGIFRRFLGALRRETWGSDSHF